MCEVLELPRSTYYKYAKRKSRDYEDFLLIKTVFEESKRRYGYRRVAIRLKDKYGLIMNHKKVSRIMRNHGLQPDYHKRLKINYSARLVKDIARPDLLKRNFHQRGWVTDITYLIFNQKRAYLSTILDLESRDIIAYRIGQRNDLTLVMRTLQEAIDKTKDPSGLILHSDRGTQYLSLQYRMMCAHHGIVISMARRSTPLDNAVIESFHASLKRETLYHNDIKDFHEYIAIIKDWLEWYNDSRVRLNKK